MNRPLIVIADTDARYLSSLEYRLLAELNENIDIEFITDPEYFKEFFNSPRTAELVAVCEKLYTDDLRKHNINHLFVLTEEETAGETAELSLNKIYKYTGIKEIFNELTYRSRDVLMGDVESEKETQIISVYSAVGGSGKTAIGLGLAKNLAINHRRVLYINTESIQSFGGYFENCSPMPTDGIRALRENQENVYANLKFFVKNDSFSYVPPFAMSLDSMNISDSMYVNLVKSAKESREYDFIIVDLETGYTKNCTSILSISNRVMLVINQDKMALKKTEYLFGNIDIRDKEKYMIICNKYEDTKPNCYLDSALQRKLPINETIELGPKSLDTIDECASLSGVRKMAYLFI